MKRKDFEEAMRKAKIEEKAIINIFKKMSKIFSKWHEIIDISFLPKEVKDEYHNMIDLKAHQIKLDVPN